MVLLNCPTKLGKLKPLQWWHLQVISCPVFNVAVFGNNLEYLDESVTLEMHNRSRLSKVHLTDRTIARVVWVHQPIALESGQPNERQSCEST